MTGMREGAVRVASRYSYAPADHYNFLGFRLARDIELTEEEAEAERKRQEELAALRQKQESVGVWTEPNTGMKLHRIPGGSFRMGSPSSEEGREDDEQPHTVRVGEFWLGETEVTQAQWQAVMGSNPSSFKGDDLPVERVSWNDIQEFIKRLNTRTGERFRLPTEAEWEYAARAGTTTAHYWGDGIGRNNANCDGCGSRWDNRQSAPVGSFKPNTFGLHDMLGNVWEWTCSQYKESYDGREQKCAVSARKYSLRGGSWYDGPGYVRSASRTLGGQLPGATTSDFASPRTNPFSSFKRPLRGVEGRQPPGTP
jgi:formylglycine-generating enzyme required for sulfatase activity